MRSGLAISVVGHAAILTLGLLFAGANPFDSVPAEAITVDIVSPNEVDNGFTEPGASAAPPQTAPSFEAVPAPVSSPQAPATPPWPQPAPQATPQPTPRANTRNTRQAAAPPQAVPTPPPFVPQVQPPPDPPPQPAPTQPFEANAGDMFGMPLTMPDGKLGGGFDAPAMTMAKISANDTATFRNHLKTCSRLPGSVAATDKIRIVLRVDLKPDGTLAGAPTLIEASASAKGPALMQSAIAALRACQPYVMLPADKYKEWKVLDLSFTPQDFVGG